jgi:hypothetical protein
VCRHRFDSTRGEFLHHGFLSAGRDCGLPVLPRVTNRIDAVDLVTAFVVGFVIEEQERRQAAETDPTRHSVAQREAWLGEGASLV